MPLAFSYLKGNLTTKRIRSDLKTENIEVPGIVVAGSQSSGKSSLLNGIELLVRTKQSSAPLFTETFFKS